MYQVYVKNLEFYGHLGVPPEERKIGHRYRATIRASVSGNAPVSDDVEESVDYVAMAQLLIDLGSTTRAHTLERFAHEFCEEALSRFSHVESIEISLEKPMPPAPIIAESTGVTFSRSRGPHADSGDPTRVL